MKRLIIIFALVMSVFTTSPAIAGQSSAAFVRAVNKIRVAHGLNKLQLHPALQKAAREQSVLMARKQKMAHTTGFGQSFASRLKRVGYRGLAAENIARGQKTLKRVLSGWMNSPGHRRNMLHPRMRYFGLSAAKAGGRNYWAMVLGG
ncbi:MAG: CAP domain-containing protein [Rhizobiaceae bacterium]